MSTDDRLNNETLDGSDTTRYLFVIHYLSIYALLLVIIGTIGNLLTIVVLLRRNLRRFVTVRYLILVSLCDLISLYGWNLNNFYKFNVSSLNSNIEDLSLIHCRLISFMTFVTLQLSSWCLTAVSLDRALSLYWQSWKQSYGKIRYTKYYLLALTCICLGVNSHILFLNGYRTESGLIVCYSTRDNPAYIYPQWQRVHLVLYNLCPFALMCLCNTYIIFVTVRSSSRAQHKSPATSVPRKGFERYRQFTALLIIVTFAFVLLTLPACIYFVFFRHAFVTKTQRIVRYMIQILLNSIQFTSHAINFFLYSFSTKSFRDELREMFNELVPTFVCVSPRNRSHERCDEKNINVRHDQPDDNRVPDDQSTLEKQRIHLDQEMQMQIYRLNFLSDFHSQSDDDDDDDEPTSF